MDEVRCPMCSTLNPSEADVCRQCGARLKPVQAVPPGGKTGPLEAGDLPPAPNWLNRIRSELPEGGEGEPSAGEGPDWLGRMREAATPGDEGPPPGEIPAWLTDYAKEESPAPAAPAVVPPPAAAPPAAPGRADVPPPAAAPPAAPGRSAAASSTATPPKPGTEKPNEISMTGETPEWLSRIRDREAKARQRPGQEPEEDWLARFRDEAIPSAPQVKPEKKEARPKPPTPSSAAVPPVAPGRSPAASTTAPPARPSGARPAAPGPAVRPPAPVPSRAAEPIPAAPQPPSPEAVPPSQNPPKVPALIVSQGGSAEPGSEDIDLESIKLPDWMSELRRGPPEVTAGERSSRDLAPATIPAWLEAMRPIDTFRSTVEIQSEDEQSVEAAGPLAGLRGVLLAEPVVAMPRSPGMDLGRVDVTERHYAQAELLQKMLEEEAHEAPVAAGRRRRLPLLRWVVGASILLAVAIPAVLGGSWFPVPSPEQWPPELVGFRRVMERIPTDRASLLVFDYEPGYSGEMEAVLGPVVDDLMTRGIPLATLATRPAGRILAERILDRYASLHGFAAGEGFVHLGYLPGSATAAQSFLAAPRQAWESVGAAPPAEDVWASPSLAGIQSAADFGAVFLFSAGAESARTWVEQAGPLLGSTPLLAVVSAGVEPILRPYYDSQDPRLDAIASGLPLALAYEQANGRQADALARWNPYGSGMLAAEALLAGGTLYGLAGWVLRRRRLPA